MPAGVRGYGKEEIGEKVGREKDKSGDGFPQISLEHVRSILERCHRYNTLTCRLREVEVSCLFVQTMGDGLPDQGNLTSSDCYSYLLTALTAYSERKTEFRLQDAVKTMTLEMCIHSKN